MPSLWCATNDSHYPNHHTHTDPTRVTVTNPLYRTKEWRQLRSVVLKQEPLCRMCRAQGRVTQAYAVDHIIPHKGDLRLFRDMDNLQPLCKLCHNKNKQIIDIKGFDIAINADGEPADPNHPWHRGECRK